ncbi:MAG: EAL domain-containing protein [Novosphingobium sp.]
MRRRLPSRRHLLRRRFQRFAARRRQFVNDMSPRRGEYFTPAYSAHLARRVPLLHAVVLVVIAAVAPAFAGSAPVWLAFGVGALLFGFMAWRAIHWLPRFVARRSLARVERDVANIAVVGPAATFAFVAWGLALYGYGTPPQQLLVQVAIGTACFGAIAGLGQSPITALRIVLCVVLPSTAFFVSGGHPFAIVVATIHTAMTLLLLFVTIGYHRDFVSLELSRQKVLVREREAARLAEVNHLHAIIDPLTGALNRRAILTRLEEMLADSAAVSPWLALVDLDGFKHVNDTHGHAAGDVVLCAIADRIDAIPEVAAYGRLGGDEFAVLLPGTLNLAEVREVVGTMCQEVRAPVAFGHEQLRVACSIGLRRTLAGVPVAECLERADAALYKAKQQHGGVAEFTAADERLLRERRAITRVFHAADLDDQIGLVYQPIVDADTGRTVAFEALARWSPDGETWLLPSKFVGLAEATGRIGDLTQTVLRKSLGEFRAWEHGFSLALNLSARDILRDEAAQWIAREVDDAGAPPESIRLEITETALINDYDRAARTLGELRGRGFRIALDDFGTGQSSLSHVHKLPLDHIKIDHSFARNLATDPSARAITGIILALARQLHLQCTIEGIETREQQAAARALGLRLMQGYLFGRPLPASEALGAIQAVA